MNAHYSRGHPEPVSLAVCEPSAIGRNAMGEVKDRWISLQGLVFVVLATIVSAGYLMAREWPVHALRMNAGSDRAGLIAMSALTVVLGVPHGALDTVFAQRSYKLRTVTAWGVFAILYLLAVGAVVLLWQFEPVLFLGAFLLISGAHFSGDPVAGTPVAARVFYGGAVIVLPALIHLSEVTRLFSFLAGPKSAALLGAALQTLAWPWLAGLLAAVVICLRVNRRTAAEIAAIGFLATFAPPLLAFTVFFCVMHSARHILRTFVYSGKRSARLLLAAALTPMLAFVLMMVAASLLLRNVPVEARLVQLVFVALSAMTVPHMAVVEPVRLMGWRLKPAPVVHGLSI